MTSIKRDARRREIFRIGALIALLAAIATVTLLWGEDMLRMAIDDVNGDQWQGVALFVMLYAVATLMLVPGSASTATAGLLFGTATGAIVSIAGATLGAAIAYSITRVLGRPNTEVLSERVTKIDRWVSDRQLRSMIVLRLLPIVPFNVLNYAAGMSPIRPVPYVAGTIIGITPGALLVAGLGSSAREPTSLVFVALLAAAIVAAVVSAGMARRFARS